MADADPGACLSRLARKLWNLAVDLRELGRYRAEVEEGVERLRERIRAEECAPGGLSPAAARCVRRRVTRDGRVGCPGRRLASTLLMEKPDASLREVAKAAGISTGTVRDVRQRLQRNENPVPPRQRRAELNAAQEVEIPATMDGGTSTAIGALDQKTATQALTRDPQLRMSEEGRLLLRLFATRVVDKQQRQRLIEWIPSRWRRTVTELAYSCSRDWYQFAKQLEVRDERKAADNEPFPI
ncbi:hypothetical protein [Streptomyces noursei]|uniref:hypothetical protein n=1 Tax=Streptomyces noursei TaxID=1971 RepID=UPI0021A8E574|nr:hypothetical protein [Streptomyces noursei]UWS69871.1 hypothetical protein N1H47_00410 [Streptomyces noursei]